MVMIVVLSPCLQTRLSPDIPNDVYKVSDDFYKMGDNFYRVGDKSFHEIKQCEAHVRNCGWEEWED